jgi:2-C-methyl-D-erythritol 4-phosphate cytidylyltransferase
MKVGAIVLAAGQGERLGAGEPKAFVMLAGRPLFMHSFERFFEAASIVALTIPKGYVQQAVATIARRYPSLKHTSPGDDERGVLTGAGGPLEGKDVRVILGGKERQDSVERGLKALGACGLVVVHDAARPLVTPRIIERILKVASDVGGAIVAVPASDTIKRVKNGMIEGTLDRKTLWNAQTPQAFRGDLLRRAFARARDRKTRGTDCASLVEKLKKPIAVLEPDGPNLKVTSPEDLAVAERLIAAGA